MCECDHDQPTPGAIMLGPTTDLNNNKTLQRSGVLYLSVWICGRDDLDNCTRSDAVLKERLQFTICPQNSVFDKSEGHPKSLLPNTEWYEQIIEGDYLDSCKCIAGFGPE